VVPQSVQQRDARFQAHLVRFPVHPQGHRDRARADRFGGRRCRGNDSYGIIIRSTGDSFYRFTLTCNSMISMERIKNSVRLLMQEPILSGDAPPGAPGEVRIGIWANGSEMRFFLNGRFQFSITDPSMPSGGFGVFARAEGETPLSVIFSDFVVSDVSYTLPTNTPLP
jgi:hypothetical protein